ncbi:MAG: MBOAT family protein, partial [Oscillospiraceae bacterium]|nr:MBOAT family protein [Oscillospiraceae bacterium]
MSFNSLAFLLFLGAVVALYYLLPAKARNPLLLAASYFFYMVYSVPLALFLVLCTLGTWAVGLKVQTSAPERKKAWLAAGVVVNIGVLAFYKYLNFMFSSVNSMLGGAGVEARLPRVDLIAPLGISFVIFQAVSYLVDVAREKIPAEKSLYYFALYLAFFPKVVQGPITKYGDVRPQFDQVHRFDWVNFRTGAMMAFYGLFMKMVVADRAAVVVNTLYASPEVYSGAALTLATVLFSLQIYFDFAGYSLTAIGSARMLGFFLKENFHQPYLSASVGEFWRRWHMSL